MSKMNRRKFVGVSSALVGATSLATGSLAQRAVADDAAAAPGADPATSDKPGKTPHTKFAVNIEMWWRKLGSYPERIRQAAALGFPAVEFWPWRGKNLDEIKATCEETGIEIAQFTAWGFVPGMNDPKFHDKFVKEIEASVETAKKINCKKMTVVGGNDQPGMTQAQMHDNIITALKRVAPIAAAGEVMLILEPMNIRVDHKGHCLYGSADAVRICREVNSPFVKINWDLYHMQISEGDLCGRLREGFDQVGYLQLADHPGRHEPGTGEIHYNRVLREAYELGYHDFVGLECNPLASELAAAQGVARADVW